MGLNHLVEFGFIYVEIKRSYFYFMIGKIGIRKMKRYIRSHGPQIISRLLFFRCPII